MQAPSQKTLWILNHYAQKPEAPGGTRHYWLSHYLSALGWRAPIVAASVELGTGRQRLAEGESSRQEEVSGVPFVWLRTPSYRGNGLGRIRNMVAYARAAQAPATIHRLPRPDVICGSSVHPLAGWAGLRLARRFRVPFIFEVRDLWPETLITFGQIGRNSLAAVALRQLERKLYRGAARIVTLLPEAWRYIEGFGVPRERVVWIPNGVALEHFPYQRPSAGSDQFNLIYFGAFGQANGLHTLLEAMAMVRQGPEGSRVRLRMIGDGPLKPSLRAQAGALGLHNVDFMDSVPYRGIPRVAAEADAFVLTVLDRPELYRFGVSMNKLFDYLAAGRPIVLASAAANNPVAEAGAGVTVPPENPEQLAEGIRAVARMSYEERVEMGERGRLYLAHQHDYKVLARRLAELLDRVVVETGTSSRATT